MRRKRGWNRKIRKEVGDILLSTINETIWSPYIQAIKHYRVRTSSSLLEAKAFVDNLPENKIRQVMQALDKERVTGKTSKPN